MNAWIAVALSGKALQQGQALAQLLRFADC